MLFRSPTNRVWEFTPATNTWRELGPMPTKRGGGIAVVLDGKIHVIGGAGYHPAQTEDVSISATVAHRTVPTHEVFDPATGRWETKAPMNVPRNHLVGGAINGKIYVMGGRVGSSFVGASSTDSVEEYDPATDMWRIRTRMPYPRSGMAFGNDGRLIYMAGGEYLDNAYVGVFRSFEAYDPARDQWYQLPPMATPRHGFAGGIINGVFYAVTGQLQSGTGGGGPGGTPAVEAFEIGKPAPAFTLPLLHEPEKSFSQKDALGKVWILNVWASWCAPCRQEHPLVVDFARRNSVPVYGLNYKDKRDAAQAWLRSLGDPYAATLVDADGKVGIDYGVYGVPETFVIDAQGVVRFKQIGPLTPEALRDKIEPLLKELGKQGVAGRAEVAPQV